MSIGIAFRAFFAALTNRKTAQRFREVLAGDAHQPAIAEVPAKAEVTVAARPTIKQPQPKPTEPGRSEALTLLSTLQREARFIDLVSESLDGFQDAQIGAAARDVLRDCKQTLDRLFAIRPLAEVEEGTQLAIPENPSPTKFRLVGSSQGTVGTVAHRGWQVTQCELPHWSGSRSEAWVLAPIEIDV